jgi:hypothetical protein
MCKTCSKCGVTYENVDGNFYKQKDKPDGFSYNCKNCCYKRKRLYIENNRDKVNKKERERYHKDKEKQLQKSKLYNTNNKDKVNKKAREWRNKNKEKSKKILNKYFLKVRDKINHIQKNHRDSLADIYVIKVIKKSRTLHIENPTPEMIKLYRELILLKREKLQLKKQIKETLNIKI